ncbi:MAG: DoxX family protein [Bacteroidetes Order II. Incertae sedis bacterium]|nr:DoxX family protein [Bacteroidetes Order II. bacterium]
MKPYVYAIARFSLGMMMMLHGWPKISGGIEKWNSLGAAMENFGIYFFPVFWGFMGAIAEFLGGILVAVGLGTRIAAAFVVMTMMVAAMAHLGKGEPFMEAAHAIETGLGFLLILCIGGGAYSLDRMFFTSRTDQPADD